MTPHVKPQPSRTYIEVSSETFLSLTHLSNIYVRTRNKAHTFICKTKQKYKEINLVFSKVIL